MSDSARKKTDRILAKTEYEVSRIYESDPALKSIRKEYAKYMAMVNQRTRDAYKAYINETDPDAKRDLKDAYEDEVRALTLDSKEYKKLVDQIASVMAKVNQRALDITNGVMSDVYAINHNQVASECKRVGIEVK